MKPKQPLLFLLFCLLFLAASSCLAQSLWKETSGSIYQRNRRLKIGDILTIKILESSSALQQAKTDLSKESDVNANLSSSWERVSNIVADTKGSSERHGNQLGIGGGDVYSGQGQTTRKSVVQATITVMISQDLGDGIYRVEGDHKLSVNQEEENISITGLVRADDIDDDNSVYSSQIGNAEISIQGSGSVSSKQNPGMLNRLFGWLF